MSQRTCSNGVRLSILAFAASLSMTVASASPPSGQFSSKDHVRAVVTEQASVKMPAGGGVVMASYVLAPDAETGWRTHPGAVVIAVAKGTLTLRRADGCTSAEYSAGQAVPLSAGRFLLQNAGDEPLEFSGVFLDLLAEITDPLAAAGREAAPEGCEGIAGYTTGGSQSGVTASTHGRGTGVGDEGYLAHAPTQDMIEVQPGKDAVILSARLEPGFSLGWQRHLPTMLVVTRGTWTYYEGHEGECVMTGKYTAGQAWVHNGNHNHFAANEGDEPVELAAITFNLPHRSSMPLAGSAADSFDFTQPPPADCPRLR